MGGSGGGGGYISPGGGSGGGFSGGGAGGAGGGNQVDPCDHVIDAPIFGPVPAEVALLHPGSILAVGSDGPPARVVLRTSAGTHVGSIAGVPGLTSLLGCLAAGHIYEAEVTSVRSGAVEVRITRTGTPA